MNSPQALSTVYTVAAKALAVVEPLSLRFERPIPYTRSNLVAATTNVTGIDISAFLGADVEEDAVFQACGLVLAQAVGNTVLLERAEVLKVFQYAFGRLIQAYCKFSSQFVAYSLTTVTVEEAVALEILLTQSWPHVRPRKQKA